MKQWWLPAGQGDHRQNRPGAIRVCRVNIQLLSHEQKAPASARSGNRKRNCPENLPDQRQGQLPMQRCGRL